MATPTKPTTLTSLPGLSLNDVSLFDGSVRIKLSSEPTYTNIGHTKNKVLSIEPLTREMSDGQELVDGFDVSVEIDVKQLEPNFLMAIGAIADAKCDLEITISHANGNLTIFELTECWLVPSLNFAFDGRGRASAGRLRHKRRIFINEFYNIWTYFTPPQPPRIDLPLDGSTTVGVGDDMSILAEDNATLTIELSDNSIFSTLLGSFTTSTNTLPFDAVLTAYRRLIKPLSDIGVTPSTRLYLRAKVERGGQTSRWSIISFTTTIDAPTLAAVSDFYTSEATMDVSWSHPSPGYLTSFKIRLVYGASTEDATISTAATSADLLSEFPDFAGFTGAAAVDIAAVAGGTEKWAGQVSFNVSPPTVSLSNPGTISIDHNEERIIQLTQTRLPAGNSELYNVSFENPQGDSDVSMINPNTSTAPVSPATTISDTDTINVPVKFSVDTGNYGSRTVDIRLAHPTFPDHVRTLSFYVQKQTVEGILVSRLWADYVADNANYDALTLTTKTAFGLSKNAYRLTSAGLPSSAGARELYNTIEAYQPYYVPNFVNSKGWIMVDFPFPGSEYWGSKGTPVTPISGEGIWSFMLMMAKNLNAFDGVSFYTPIRHIFWESNAVRVYIYSPTGTALYDRNTNPTFGYVTGYNTAYSEKLTDETPFLIAAFIKNGENAKVKELDTTRSSVIYEQTLSHEQQSTSEVKMDLLHGAANNPFASGGYFAFQRLVVANGDLTDEEAKRIMNLMWKEAGY